MSSNSPKRYLGSLVLDSCQIDGRYTFKIITIYNDLTINHSVSTDGLYTLTNTHTLKRR